MREVFEFRVAEEFAHRLFRPSEGRKLGVVRVIKIDGADARFPKIGQLDESLRRRTGRPFFFSWNVKRYYSPDELGRAKLFLLYRPLLPEPTPEDIGTQYDETTACGRCGAGALQTNALVLKRSSLSKKRDIGRCLGGENVISSRAVSVLREGGVTGLKLRPVLNARTRQPMGDWHQLVEKNFVKISVPPTIAANGPFDPDANNEYRCPFGDTIGLNLLSEATVENAGSSDIVWSKQFVGTRGGIVRPDREILVSPRFRRIVLKSGLSGFEFERAHILGLPDS